MQPVAITILNARRVCVIELWHRDGLLWEHVKGVAPIVASCGDSLASPSVLDVVARRIYCIYMMKTARIFQSGGSQAVRLPKEFRVHGETVSIRREGAAIILEPIRPPKWPARFWERVRITDAGFERPRQGETQDRRPLNGGA